MKRESLLHVSAVIYSHNGIVYFTVYN